MNKTIVASVLTTLAVLLIIGGLGVFAARTAFADLKPVSAVAGALWHGHGGHGGHGGRGMTNACSRLDENHIAGHAAELHRWASEELTLDDSQSSALAVVTDSLGEWALDLRPVCEMPREGAPAHVAAVVKAAHTTDLALQRFATAFDVFYATLTQEQRTRLDGWFEHGHGEKS